MWVPQAACPSAHAGYACLPRQRLPPFGRIDRRRPQAVRRLSAMQCFSDLADRQKRAGSGLFNFQPRFVVSLNEADEVVQFQQRFLRRLSFCQFQGFNYSFCSRGFTHFERRCDVTIESSHDAHAGKDCSVAERRDQG